MSIAPISHLLKAPLAKSSRLIRLTGICAGAGLLAACAQQPTMYSWDSYQPAAYAYMQGDQDPVAQVEAMEENIESARAQNKALPPGFHAHLGLLYLQQGQGARAMEQIQSERISFPESATFMDFLLRNNKKSEQQDGNIKGTKEVQESSSLSQAAKPTPRQPS
jgi:hypothetical protein